jgi:glycosyltransferase involved in cell wall biosynthesis
MSAPVNHPDPNINIRVRRVAYIHDTNVYGGVEVFMLLLMKYLDPRRYTPVVLVPGYTDPVRSSPPRLLRQVEEMGLPLIRLPVRPEIAALGTVRQIQDTMKILRSNLMDVIHIHTCRPAGARIPTISAWLSGVPALLRTEHGPPLGVTSLTRFTVKPLDWMTDFVLTVSDATLEDQVRMVHRNRKKLYRSYGGIELDRFDPKRNTREAKVRIGLDPDLPVVGAVGRLMPEKGHIHLINAASQVIEKYGPINFLLAGEGPLEQQLKIQVEELGLRKFFHIFGTWEIGSYREAMDFGVMPSLYEGLPLSLLEFMALGIPTVTSSVPCFQEVIIDGESGFIASLDDENDLAEKILELLFDPERAFRMGQAALERVHTQFSIQRLAADMMDLYDRILASRSHRHRPLPLFR